MLATFVPRYPRLAEKLSALVSYPTVSSYTPADEDETAFSALKAALPTLFPSIHSTISREEPSDRALLYTWLGKEPDSPPVILCAHFDVVPPGDPEKWKRGAFSGDIAEGCIWGRGTQDIKVLLASMLEAADTLAAAGFRPRRTVYFAFGGDEETGGSRGAAAIALRLKAKGVQASFLLDEGGPIAIRLIGFAQRPLALVGVAEKGYLDLTLSAPGTGGHASMPPRRTAPGALARAICAIESHPSPARFTKTVRSFVSSLAKEASQPYRFLLSNLWLFAPVLKAAFGSSPTTDALIRTTRACTMLQASPKENVLADCAEATVNMRILPGESVEEAVHAISSLVERFGVTASAKHPGHEVEPSEESSTEGEGWKLVCSALAASHPEAACLPFLFSAGTDTKHYRGLVRDTYRFTCLPQDGEDLKGVHGENERLRLEDLDRCALFYENLIRSL
ncbi:MAG TPA: M20/M25/M40 family metallo-hydrolase [Rectinemataceae bacterium]